MKSKIQKQQELKLGRELYQKSNALIFIDCSKVKTADLRKLRQELKRSGNYFLVIKKRLLGLIMKEEGQEFDSRNFKTSTGTVFVSDLENAAASIYKFFKELEADKKINTPAAEKILGGYNLKEKSTMSVPAIVFIGQLPPREALLAQLLGMIAAPIKSLLYILKQKARLMGLEQK